MSIGISNDDSNGLTSEYMSSLPLVCNAHEVEPVGVSQSISKFNLAIAYLKLCMFIYLSRQNDPGVFGPVRPN